MDSVHTELLGTIDLKQLGRRLRAARTAAGLTQADLAGTDVSVGYVSRIESGQRRPNAQVLATLAGRLGTSAEELLTGVPPRLFDQVRLTLDYAELSLESGEPGEALGRAEEARDLARGAGLADMATHACFLRARALEGLGALDDAILELEPLATKLSGIARAEAGIALCRCYRESGDFAQSIETGERILELLTTMGLDRTDEGVRMAVTLAAAYFERGDVSHAVRVCRTAVSTAETLDSPSARASAYWNASMMEAQQGAVHHAVPLAERALALMSEGQDARNLARLRTELGEMQLWLNPPRVEDARENLEQAARELVWSSASSVEVSRNQLSLGRALLLGDSPQAALDLARQVHDAVGDRAPFLAADAKTLEGQAWAAQGWTAEASAAYRQAVLLLTGIGADRTAAQLWFDLAGLLEEVGELEAARQAYKSAAASRGLRTRSVRVKTSALADGQQHQLPVE